MCDAVGAQGQCRITGSHPLHVAGYGEKKISWANQDFTPPARPMSDDQMVEIQHRILNHPVS